MRKLKSFRSERKNSLLNWYRVKNPLIVALNFVLIYPARYMPSLRVKNFLYRLTGMKVGHDVAVGLGAVFDIFFPELIEIGDNCIIGYGVTVLAHEFLHEEWRTGRVKIGRNVLIGANSTILAGVSIGDNSKVSACSLVNDDIPANSFYAGVPARKVKGVR
ncbi:acyltransferase [Candidatus Micrarchaeota archaeon]|nr:acyltransferase [Candidatus Micrarchaeota archaeon]